MLFFGGVAVSYLLGREGLGYAISWVAVLIASITQFEVEDRGPQRCDGRSATGAR